MKWIHKTIFKKHFWRFEIELYGISFFGFGIHCEYSSRSPSMIIQDVFYPLILTLHFVVPFCEVSLRYTDDPTFYEE